MAKIKNKNKSNVLENTIDPESFFDLGLFSTGRIGSKQIKVTISQKHMYLADRLRESGLFRISTPDMNRGLMMMGLLADCLHNHICQKKATNIIKQSRGCRRLHNVKEINIAVGHLDYGEDSNELLLKNYMKYGNSTYGGNILNFIPDYIEHSPRPKKVPIVRVPVEIINLCKAYSQAPPTDARFIISKKAKNERFMLWVPNHIKVMAFSMMKSSIINTRLMSDIYRGGYITGLYILCKWIVENRLPIDEYCLCKMMHNIYNYLTEHE